MNLTLKLILMLRFCTSNRFETEANDNLEITFSHSDISQYYFIT